MPGCTRIKAILQTFLELNKAVVEVQNAPPVHSSRRAQVAQVFFFSMEQVAQVDVRVGELAESPVRSGVRSPDRISRPGSRMGHEWSSHQTFLG